MSSNFVDCQDDWLGVILYTIVTFLKHEDDVSIFDLVIGLAPPPCTNEFIQPNRALKSDMAELPEHLFVAELLPRLRTH